MSFLTSNWNDFRSNWRSSGLAWEFRRSAAAFCVLLLLGFGLALALPELRNGVLRFFLAFLESMEVVTDSGTLSPTILLSNNLRACSVAILYGLIPFAYFTALALGTNAMLLGVMAAYYVAEGHSMLLYLAALIPHGIFELPALVLSFAAGLFLCGQITRRIRHDETAWPLSQCVTLVSQTFLFLILPLLAVAALMEAYVTPLFIALFL